MANEYIPSVDPAALRHFWTCSRAHPPGILDPGLTHCLGALVWRACIISVLANSTVRWRWSLNGEIPDSETFRVAANWMFRDFKDIDLDAIARAIDQHAFVDPTDDDEKRGIPSRRLSERLKSLAQTKPHSLLC